MAPTVAGRSAGSRLAARLTQALPTLGTALAGAMVWALAMGASAIGELVLSAWETPQRVREVALLFAAGGAVAFPVGLFFARLLSQGRRNDTAFAAAFLCLALATIAATGALYGLQYRLYYAQWHADPFTRIWFLQFLFTVAVALYQFAVLGLRLYFPLGFIALLAASLWFVRRAR